MSPCGVCRCNDTPHRTIPYRRCVDHRTLFSTQPVARLATVRPDGSPHLVPITFAVIDDTIYQAIDHKPKRSAALQRTANLAADPRCTLLADHYDENWDRLWWVRADATGRMVSDPDEQATAIAALAAKYPQYRTTRPTGSLIAFDVTRWAGWRAADDQRPARPPGTR